MKTQSVTARRAMTVAFGVGAALVVGVAFALWTATGSGSGSVKTINAQQAVVTTDAAAATAELYPGFNGGDLFFQVTNPNPYGVQFTSMTPGTITSSNPTACPATNLSVQSPTGLTINVPANQTTAVSRNIANVATLASAAPDGCQGVTFTVPVTLNGTQQ